MDRNAMQRSGCYVLLFVSFKLVVLLTRCNRSFVVQVIVELALLLIGDDDSVSIETIGISFEK